MSLQPGSRLGGYEIVGTLGAGGMGEVYRARDLKLGREVAIKVLPEEFARDPGRVSRFEREARMLAAVNHPTIAAIYGAEEDGDVRYIVMELVEGDTLAERLTAGPLPVIDALRIGAGIAEALEIAHEKGVIHRDLKPANIKLTREGRVKVLDFGLAKAMDLPFAGDADRIMRFEREAKTLAALNHPHIAHIHGIEDSGATRALVMELVEGEDLAQRLARGAIPLDESLAIAEQIADALQAAHAAGIVHRDLKPANVKLRPDGTIKVLDFGLAKAGGSTGPGSDDLSNSPTFTSPLATMQGVILGTAAYMSPEQARGKPVDSRADIWAFGCVLYEMLTGRRAFGGEDITDTITAVLRDAPDWSAVPAGTPAHVVRVMRRCLEKDVRQRLRDIGDARLELATARETSDEKRSEPSHRVE